MQAAVQHCKQVATTQGQRLAQPCGSNCTVQHSSMQPCSAVTGLQPTGRGTLVVQTSKQMTQAELDSKTTWLS